MSDLANELDVLEDVSGRFASAGVPFMLTGSLALNFYSQPRMTRDIDLVVELHRLEPAHVVNLFQPDYYASEEGVASAIAHTTLFNLIHQASVIKVDCIIRKAGAYRMQEFARRRRIRVRDFETWIVSKEDLLLSKLSWFADSESERQLEDVRNLIATGFDAAYVATWINELGLTQPWKRASASGHHPGNA